MAKSMGQIHTVNVSQEVNSAGDSLLVDFPFELSDQLNRLIRSGNFFKLVGIDAALNTVGTVGGGQVSGYLRYYAPTRGRVLAYRNAFQAMKSAMELQGIKMSSNKMYDFRPKFNATATYPGGYPNQANLAGGTGSTTNALVLHDNASPGSDHSVFGVYNRSVKPVNTQAGGDLFGTGFNTMGVQSTPTDFVINDQAMYTGNPLFASLEWESIPFTMSWTPDSTDIATNFQWRPDPALFLAILTGQIECAIEEVNLDGDPTPAGVNITWAFHISGWKSIMSDKKPQRRMSKRKRSRRTKR